MNRCNDQNLALSISLPSFSLPSFSASSFFLKIEGKRTLDDREVLFEWLFLDRSNFTQFLNFASYDFIVGHTLGALGLLCLYQIACKFCYGCVKFLAHLYDFSLRCWRQFAQTYLNTSTHFSFSPPFNLGPRISPLFSLRGSVLRTSIG